MLRMIYAIYLMLTRKYCRAEVPARNHLGF